jgi:large repetitive protein
MRSSPPRCATPALSPPDALLAVAAGFAGVVGSTWIRMRCPISGLAPRGAQRVKETTMNPYRRNLSRCLLVTACLLLSASAAQAQVDSDGDTILDSIECVQPLIDSDGDGTPNCYDIDDDNDGIALENAGDTDGDGLADYIDADDDGDGIPTAEEGENDDDYDFIPNWLDSNDEDGPQGDLDGDGLSNEDEEALGSDPDDNDSDDDTVFDGEEVGPDGEARDSDGDGRPDILDTDDDGDGIPTRVEHDAGAYSGSDQDNPPNGNEWDDVDDDGIPNHLDEDSDGDGKSDHVEAFGEGVPNMTLAASDIRLVVGKLISISPRVVIQTTEWTFPDKDGDGIANWLDGNDIDGPLGDPDLDGLTNQQEENRGSNPLNDDTDGDGILDGAEHTDHDGDGVKDVLDPDDDGDGILTRDEGSADLDSDGIPNRLDTDSDGDGEPDSSDVNPGGPCRNSQGFWEAQIPDGENTDLGYCTDRDCDGIADNQESAASYYVGGQVHYFSVNPATGNWSFWWYEPGHTVQPALIDGPCAYQDYDCDGEPNWSDADWTDGTC